MNKYICKGNLTRDPESKQTTSGKTVCEFGIAVNGWGKDSPALFWEVTAWERTGERVMQFLKKGNHVLLEGRIDEDTWDDKQNGQKRSKKKFICEVVHLLGGRQDSDASEPQPKSDYKRPVPPPALPPAQVVSEDDIPY